MRIIMIPFKPWNRTVNFEFKILYNITITKIDTAQRVTMAK